MITVVPDDFEFPAADTDNIIYGSGVVKNGFSLEDATTTCTFRSLFPASGALDLNGGTLMLESDLYFDNKPSSLSSGSIIGNGNTLSLASGTEVISTESDETSLHEVEMLLATDITVHGIWRFSGASNIIKGQGNSITLGDDAVIIIDEGSKLTL